MMLVREVGGDDEVDEDEDGSRLEVTTGSSLLWLRLVEWEPNDVENVVDG